MLWYLVPDEGHNEDGRHIHYLAADDGGRQKWLACDPDLYAGLKNLVDGGRRSIGAVERGGILPGAVFHGEPLAYGTGEPPPVREAKRKEWLNAAVATCDSADLVFLDPDNGLEVKAGKLSKTGPKYVFFEDLRRLANDDRSLIVYQHANRHGDVTTQIRNRLGQIREHFPQREPFALRFWRVSSRAFLVVPAQNHREALRKQVDRFLNSPWKAHFDLVEQSHG